MKATAIDSKGDIGLSPKPPPLTAMPPSAAKPAAKEGGGGAGPEGPNPGNVEGVPNETLFVGNLSYK